MTEFVSDKFSWRIEQGDALSVLADIEADSVDLVLTDPPYNIGYPYGFYDDSLEWEDYFVFGNWIFSARRVVC